MGLGIAKGGYSKWAGGGVGGPGGENRNERVS